MQRGGRDKQKQTNDTRAHKNKSQLKDRAEKINRTNSQAMKRTLTPRHHSTCTPLVLLFVLYGSVNLNKERNKRARCLGVDALAANAPLPHCADEHRGGTETTEAQCQEVVPTDYRKHLSSK